MLPASTTEQRLFFPRSAQQLQQDGMTFKYEYLTKVKPRTYSVFMC